MVFRQCLVWRIVTLPYASCCCCCALLTRHSRPCVQQFTSKLVKATFEDGDFIVKQGDMGDRFFILEGEWWSCMLHPRTP